MSSRMPLHLAVMHQYRRHTPEDVHRRTMRRKLRRVSNEHTKTARYPMTVVVGMRG